MHPKQAQLNKQASRLMDFLSAKKPPLAGAALMLWKYTDPDGNEFWLKTKRMTVKSPITGKSFSAKPVRESPSGIGQDLREEAKSPPAGSGPGPKVQTKRKKTADEENLEWRATSFEQPVSDPQPSEK